MKFCIDNIIHIFAKEISLGTFQETQCNAQNEREREMYEKS